MFPPRASLPTEVFHGERYADLKEEGLAFKVQRLAGAPGPGGLERADVALAISLYVDWIDVVQARGKRKLGIFKMRFVALQLVDCLEPRFSPILSSVLNLPFKVRRLRQFSFTLAVFQDEP